MTDKTELVTANNVGHALDYDDVKSKIGHVGSQTIAYYAKTRASNPNNIKELLRALGGAADAQQSFFGRQKTSQKRQETIST